MEREKEKREVEKMGNRREGKGGGQVEGQNSGNRKVARETKEREGERRRLDVGEERIR